MAISASRFLPYLQLLRVPNAVTAIADVSAGMLIAGAAHGDWGIWCCIAAASVCLYGGGAALNDVCDHVQDGVERPDRPIPSGRASRTVAAMLSTALLLAGVALAWQGSGASGVVAVAVVLAIVLYDAAFKRAPFAPAIMGACRALNLAMGMFAVIEVQAFRLGLVLPLAFMWLYVSSVTYFARREAVGSSSKKQLTIGAAGVVLPVVGVLWLRPFVGGGRVVFLAIVAGGVAYLASLATRAVTEPTPERVQHAVGRFVLGIVVLDALLTWTVRGPWLAAFVFLWLAPAVALSRPFRVT